MLKQYLQFLYKITFSQTFANFRFQRRALEDLIVETHQIFYGENVLWKGKRKGFNQFY